MEIKIVIDNLYRNYHYIFIHFAERLVSGVDMSFMAEDLVQETYLRLLNSKSFNHNIKNPSFNAFSYAITTLYRLCIHVRSNYSATPFNDCYIYQRYDPVWNSASASFILEEIGNLLSIRECIIFKYYILKGYSYNEIAHMIHSTPQSVSKSMYRIREKILKMGDFM